jgi:hypothetical protein
MSGSARCRGACRRWSATCAAPSGFREGETAAPRQTVLFSALRPTHPGRDAAAHVTQHYDGQLMTSAVCTRDSKSASRSFRIADRLDPTRRRPFRRCETAVDTMLASYQRVDVLFEAATRPSAPRRDDQSFRDVLREGERSFEGSSLIA